MGLGKRKVRGKDYDGRSRGRDRGLGRGVAGGEDRPREGNPPEKRVEFSFRKGLTSASGSKGSSKSVLLSWPRLSNPFGSNWLLLL